MPSEVTFYNDDIDDGGAETAPVSFAETNSGLSFDFSTDVGFSNGTTAPSSFDECTYQPSAGYDTDVSFICFNPKGAMMGQSSVSLSFRARIE